MNSDYVTYGLETGSGKAPELFSNRRQQKPIKPSWLEELAERKRAALLDRGTEFEINRAIKSVKKSDMDIWFQRAWWREAGRRGQVDDERRSGQAGHSGFSSVACEVARG